MVNILAVAALLTIPNALGTDPPEPPPIEEAKGPVIGFKTVTEALAALRKDETAQFSEQNGWTIVKVGTPGQPGFSLWSFTPASHPAYPAAVKRTVYEKAGQVMMGMQVRCEAKKKPCDQLVRDFKELNERTKQAVRPSNEP